MLIVSSIMLLKNIYSTRVTHDNRHMTIKIFYSAGHLVSALLNVFCNICLFRCLIWLSLTQRLYCISSFKGLCISLVFG
jgi:hypothetical protein